MIVPRSALKAVSLAMGVKDIRKELNGMLIQCSGRTVRLVATDGHRMHLMDIPQDIPCPPLVEGAIMPLFATLDHAPDARLFSPVADDAPIE